MLRGLVGHNRMSSEPTSPPARPRRPTSAPGQLHAASQRPSSGQACRPRGHVNAAATAQETQPWVTVAMRSPSWRTSPSTTCISCTVPALLGEDGDLHLHRLEDDQGVAGGDLRARLDEDLPDAGDHLRVDLLDRHRASSALRPSLPASHPSTGGQVPGTRAPGGQPPEHGADLLAVVRHARPRASPVSTSEAARAAVAPSGPPALTVASSASYQPSSRSPGLVAAARRPPRRRGSGCGTGPTPGSRPVTRPAWPGGRVDRSWTATADAREARDRRGTARAGAGGAAQGEFDGVDAVRPLEDGHVEGEPGGDLGQLAVGRRCRR